MTEGVGDVVGGVATPTGGAEGGEVAIKENEDEGSGRWGKGELEGSREASSILG